MSAVRIRASWYPSTESGRLIDADANPAHIGGIVAMGTGRIDHTVIVDRPRRFVITTEAHAPFAFIVSPDMSEVVISEGSRVISRHTMPLLEASYHYPTPAENLERPPVTQQNFIPHRPGTVASAGVVSYRSSRAYNPPWNWEHTVTIIGMPAFGRVDLMDPMSRVQWLPRDANVLMGRWADAQQTRWQVALPDTEMHFIHARSAPRPDGSFDLRGMDVRAGTTISWDQIPIVARFSNEAAMEQRVAFAAPRPQKAPFVARTKGTAIPVAPSGFPSGRTVPTIPLNERARPSEAVRYYQRIMLGTGFGTGEQASDGILGTNTANAVQSWARWYNGLPEGPMASPLDLKRGAVVTVDRALTPEKQLAMQRFEARASDVLAQITSTNTTVVTPPAPPPPAPVVNVAPAGFPWLGAAGLTIAAATLFAFLKYANDNQKKQATARSAATRRGSR